MDNFKARVKAANFAKEIDDAYSSFEGSDMEKQQMGYEYADMLFFYKQTHELRLNDYDRLIAINTDAFHVYNKGYEYRYHKRYIENCKYYGFLPSFECKRIKTELEDVLRSIVDFEGINWGVKNERYFPD